MVTCDKCKQKVFSGSVLKFNNKNICLSCFQKLNDYIEEYDIDGYTW